MDKTILCVRSRRTGPTQTDIEYALSLHDDMVAAVASKNPQGLLTCDFFELEPVSNNEVFHAACQAQRWKRDKAVQEAHETCRELHAIAQGFGIELEEE